MQALADAQVETFAVDADQLGRAMRGQPGQLHVMGDGGGVIGVHVLEHAALGVAGVRIGQLDVLQPVDRAKATDEAPAHRLQHPEIEVMGAVVVARRNDGAAHVRTRPARGLLGGMSEFPGSDWSDAPVGVEAAPLKLDWRAVGPVRHVFTHFALTLDVFVAEAPGTAKPPPRARWVAADALAREALPSLMRKVARLAGL